MGCENGGNVLTLGAGGNQPQTRLPLVVVGHDGGVVVLGLLELEWRQWGLDGRYGVEVCTQEICVLFIGIGFI